MKVAGSIALVTGANRGLGLAFAGVTRHIDRRGDKDGGAREWPGNLQAIPTGICWIQQGLHVAPVHLQPIH